MDEKISFSLMELKQLHMVLQVLLLKSVLYLGHHIEYGNEVKDNVKAHQYQESL